VARPRAADDFKYIRERMEELRLERARALTRQYLGSPAKPPPPDRAIAKTSPGFCVPLFFGSSPAEVPRVNGVQGSSGLERIWKWKAIGKLPLHPSLRPCCQVAGRRPEAAACPAV